MLTVVTLCWVVMLTSNGVVFTEIDRSSAQTVELVGVGLSPPASSVSNDEEESSAVLPH